MTKRSRLQAICIATSLALLTVNSASATAATAMQDRENVGREGANAERGSNSRLNRGRQQPARNQAPAAPSPEEVMAEAQQILTANNVRCQPTEAKLLGVTAEQQKFFEIACANDFGYMLVTTTPVTIVDCYENDTTQARQKAANPEAVLGPKCTLPANANYDQVIASMATEAGVPCAVNEYALIGRKGSNYVYEVGCEGADGYRLNRKDGGGWEVDSCLTLASANITCNYTTKPEQIATVKTWFNGSDAASCDVADVRYMGSNANGSFVEAKCNGSDGIIARLDNAKAVQQVYPCAEAAQIGGGCKLTDGAPQGTNGTEN